MTSDLEIHAKPFEDPIPVFLIKKEFYTLQGEHKEIILKTLFNWVFDEKMKLGVS